MVFLNPREAAWRANCRARPWKPKKYATQAEREAGRPFLLDWCMATIRVQTTWRCLHIADSLNPSAGPSRKLEQPKCHILEPPLTTGLNKYLVWSGGI